VHETLTHVEQTTVAVASAIQPDGYPQRSMSEPSMTVEQAYEAAYHFVWQYRERERTPGPESLDLMLVHTEPQPNAPRKTNDAAAWEDWELCVTATLAGAPLPVFDRE
jgi:hypothetical protein